MGGAGGAPLFFGLKDSPAPLSMAAENETKQRRGPMPLLKLETSVSVQENRRDYLLKSLSSLLAETTGKPEAYVMVTLGEIKASMGGRTVPAALADIRGIGGLSKPVNAKLSADICALLKKELNINPENVYLTFTEVPAQNWGWKGSTFG